MSVRDHFVTRQLDTSGRKLTIMRAREFNGGRCRELRERHKLTLVELAERITEEVGLPVSKYAVSKWERGTRSPSPKRFGALCRVLAVDEEELLLQREAGAA